MAREELDEHIREIFETYAWGILIERIKEHAGTLRSAGFNIDLADEVRLGKLRELHGLRSLFDSIYRQVGKEMPADLRKAFE